jgi:hypothetical protein
MAVNHGGRRGEARWTCPGEASLQVAASGPIGRRNDAGDEAEQRPVQACGGEGKAGGDMESGGAQVKPKLTTEWMVAMARQGRAETSESTMASSGHGGEEAVGAVDFLPPRWRAWTRRTNTTMQSC